MRELLVRVLGLNFQFLFAGFANPVVFAVNERVVVDAVSVVVRTQVALHPRIVSGLQLLCSGAQNDEIHAAIGGPAFEGVVIGDRAILAVSDSR